MKNVFIKFLSTYILILLIPIILGWSIYEIVLNQFETYIKSTHLALLNQTREIIDSYARAIEWRAFQIANNSKLQQLMYAEESSAKKHISLIREIVNELASYVIYTNNFNTTFYIYLKELDMIITPNSSYQLSDFIRAEVFFRVEGMTALEWHEKILAQYFPGVFLETKTIMIEDFSANPTEVVPYIQSLPLGYNKSPDDITGVILFFIRQEEFSALLNNITIPAGGWAYIADETGAVITGHGNQSKIQPISFDTTEQEGLKRTTIDGKEMFMIYTTSAVNNWKYIVVLPTDFVLDKVRIIKVLSLVVFLVSALISILLSILIAYRRAKPIKEMINLLQDTHETGPKTDLSKMDVLSGSITRIINRNQDMQLQLQEQLKFVRTAFFNNLLNGYFRNLQELNLFLSYAGITITEKKFVVLLLNLTGYESLASMDIIEELQKVKAIVKSTLEQVFEDKVFFNDTDERSIAVIVALSADQDSACQAIVDKALQKFLNKISDYYKAKPQMGIGNICSSLLEINNSFEQAKEALNYLLKFEKDFFAWFHNIHKETQEYYFPLELEMRLLNSSKAGDKEQVTNILHTIYLENMQNRNLLPEKLQELFYEMHGTLIKIKNQVALDNNINIKIDLNAPTKQVFQELQHIYLTICEKINVRKKSHNTELIKRIISFLEEEYSNPNLCLYSVASHFSINESYLSYFYKEQTGMNFSFYLEKLRMDHATVLLADSKLAIKEIANQVGYNSDKTFRRVFKRVKGVSPSRFRQEQSAVISGIR